MKRITVYLTIFLVSLAFFACRQPIPAGHVGRTWEPSGFSPKILGPGKHACWGHCQMYRMEVSDRQVAIPMKVLCADSLNFHFNVGILAAVNKEDPEKIKQAFDNITPQDGYTVSSEQLFGMYVKPIVDQEARKVASKYRTDEIVENRAKIIEEIRAAIKKELAGSLVVVKMITVNNLDFEESITKAQEEKAKRRIEIDTEKAKQEKRVIEAQNELVIAELQYKKELIEASMVADANKIIGASITPQYLGYKQLEVIQQAASGPNNWGFVPYKDHMNVDAAKWTQPQAVLDTELIKRIQDARKSEATPEAPTAEAAPSE